MGMTDEKKIIFSMMGVSKTIPPQRKDYKGYLSFLFLWGKNRGDRFERFRKIDVIENYCRVRPELRGEGDLVERTFYRVFATGASVG